MATSQSSNRVIEWNDDERKGGFSCCYSTNKVEEYIPITKIMKEFYQEEKNRLYASSTESDVSSEYSYNSYWDNVENDMYSTNTLEYYDDAYEDNQIGSCSEYEGDEDKDDETSDLEKIIENQVYKKFSYV